MLQDLAREGIVAVFGMVVSLLPLVVAVRYMVRPGEHLLGLMRPLSLATIFAALNTFFSSAAALARHLPAMRTPAGYNADWIAHNVSEGMTPIFVAFGFLAAAWLCVGVGMWRAAR
jgi:hypothetical protein